MTQSFFLDSSGRFFVLTFFLPTIHRDTFHYLLVGFLISVDISKVYVMSSTTSQSFPSFNTFFNKEKATAETATKLAFILSIWDDDHIRRLDEKTWKCLWCNRNVQGINATKDIAHVLEKKGLNIKSFYVAKDKAHKTTHPSVG